MKASASLNNPATIRFVITLRLILKRKAINIHTYIHEGLMGITAGDSGRCDQHRVCDLDGSSDCRHRDKYREGERDVADHLVLVPHCGRVCDRGSPASV